MEWKWKHTEIERHGNGKKREWKKMQMEKKWKEMEREKTWEKNGKKC